MSAARATVRLSQPQIDRLVQLIAMKGLSQVARFLGMNTRTIQVASLGGAVQPATLALLEKKFAERNTQGKVP